MSNGGTGKAPGQAMTRLALRTWQIDRASLAVRSLNAPAGRANWIARQMAQPAGNWPHDHPLAADCRKTGPLTRKKKGEEVEVEHGPVPSRDCTCGIYATTSLEVVNGYLRHDSPVLGVVELGGRLITAEWGYRAAYARVAAILLIDPALTEPWSLLQQLAAAYKVPALVPHSQDAEDYRDLLGLASPGSLLADEAEAWLREHGGLS